MMAVSGSGGESRYYRPGAFGGFSFFPPVIKALLITNGLMWVLFGIILPAFKFGSVPIFVIFREYLELWPLGTNFWPWQLITYMFLHGGFWHIFFNMLMLWMFGMELEYTWGSAKFLTYYLLCGVGAGVANLLVAPLLGQVAPTVGASGAIFGVLIAFGMLWPDRPIYVYFLLPIRAKYFIAASIAIELFTGITGSSDGVAHVAHLGGAAVGFLYIVAQRRSGALRRLVGSFGRGERPSRTRAWRGEEPEVRDARFYDIGGPPRKEKRDDQEVTQEVIDAILDKISTGGYQSLTEEEKRILNEASRKIH
ncbi:MAG TPA: rhomboid family intramembrane serine protease [Bacteroidota bacterium]|nr:rhomboid family intramembrane serine protease [Bacteroidota bacterium]